MPLKMDDKSKTRDIVITRSCVVDGKIIPVGTKVTTSLSDGNFLIAARKAVAPEDYKKPEKVEKPEKK